MLKRREILCGLIFPLAFLVSAHVCIAQFSDNFSDGDFSNNPSWSGDDSRFAVENNRLRLTAPPATDIAYLSTASAAINDAVWEFFVHMDFATSATNYADVYLVSDHQALSGSLNGYFVRIGNSTDEVSLYRQSGTTKTEIIDGMDARVVMDPVQVRVRITRDADGDWELFTDTSPPGTYVSEGVAEDSTHPSSSHVGLLCAYTATRSTGFYFDDFNVSGEPFVDPSTPGVYKDVIITEIFADPAPSLGLPEAEFIELYNRSSKIINLNGWKLTDGSSTAVLPGRFFHPNEYVILTSSTAAAQFAPGSAIGLSNFPTLNNSGDQLVLKTNDDQMIDAVAYADTWYRDDDKKQGGFTLELIDPGNPCGEEENWIASEATVGGTPGAQNSVFANKPDVTGPKLISAIPQSGTELMIRFNEKLDDQIPVAADFVITPPQSISGVSFPDASLRSLQLTLSGNLEAGTPYLIEVQNIRDCSGNLTQAGFDNVVFGLPEEADSLDVIVNEILFNPRPTGVDFVELYNNTEKFINLKNWSVANYESGALLNTRLITAEDLLLSPHQYLVFTENSEILLGEYLSADEENIFEVTSLPAFNDDAGSVAMVNPQNRVVDFFEYTDDYHVVFIDDDEGVSLERISFTDPTNVPDNWKSASSTAAFATPGYVNSNVSNPQPAGDILVDPEAFEPISGQPGFTKIQYNFDHGGFVANVKILDFQGREIKQIVNNATLGTAGFFRWDGDTNDGTKARIGYYVVWVEVFDANGQLDTFRKRVVVATNKQ